MVFSKSANICQLSNYLNWQYLNILLCYLQSCNLCFWNFMNIRAWILRKQKWDLKNTNSLGLWWVIMRIELLVIVTHNMLCGFNTLYITYYANRPWCYRIIAKHLANQWKFTLPEISWKLLLWFQEKYKLITHVWTKCCWVWISFQLELKRLAQICLMWKI